MQPTCGYEGRGPTKQLPSPVSPYRDGQVHSPTACEERSMALHHSERLLRPRASSGDRQGGEESTTTGDKVSKYSHPYRPYPSSHTL